MSERRGWIIALAAGATLIAGIVWRASVTPIRIDAPEPARSADLPDTLPGIPCSVLLAPIVFDLGPAIAQFEEDIPRRFGSIDRRIRADSSSRRSFAFAAERTPFAVRVDGTELVIETVLEYEGRGWYDPILGPELSAGCGSGDEPKPRLRLRIVSVPSFAPDWTLHTVTRAEVTRYSNEPRDQCQVSVLRIDVTERVVEAVQARMARLVSRFDRKVEGRDTRARIETIWRRMERPIRLNEGVWLLLRPGAAQLASFSGGGDSLVAWVRLESRPTIVTGVAPADSAPTTPIPPLGTIADGNLSGEMDVALEGVFSYDAASGILRKQLVGRSIRMAWRQIRIEEIALHGIGGGRVALGVSCGGAVTGRIFFTGTPRLDPSTRSLTVPDLDFDLGSTSLPANGLSWWRSGALRDFLRARATIPDSIALGGLQRLAERKMNRDLAAGVRLEVALRDPRGLAVLARRDQLIVRAVSGGEARLVVDRVLGRVRPGPVEPR